MKKGRWLAALLSVSLVFSAAVPTAWAASSDRTVQISSGDLDGPDPDGPTDGFWVGDRVTVTVAIEDSQEISERPVLESSDNIVLAAQDQVFSAGGRYRLEETITIDFKAAGANSYFRIVADKGLATEKVYEKTGLNVTAPAGKPTLSYRLPSHLKLGQALLTEGANVYDQFSIATIQNALYSDGQLYDYNRDTVAQSALFAYHHDAGGPGAKGHTSYIKDEISRAMHPGSVVLQAKTPSGSNFGAPYTVTVEEPKIETNAPQKIKLGSVFHFTTKLENTALSNEKVEDAKKKSAYDTDDFVGSHPLAFAPKVEILEGAELVTRSGGDYSNTLSSSETWSFTGLGTVKLKVQYATILPQNIPEYCDCYSNPYTAEKIIEIEVTKETPITTVTNPDSGVSATGPIPAGCTVAADELTEGELYDAVKASVNTVSDQFQLLDICLLDGDQTVQPDGSIVVTLPVPDGFDGLLGVFRLEEDGTFTLLDSIDNEDGTLSFLTEHLSYYVIVNFDDSSSEEPPVPDQVTPSAPDPAPSPDSSRGDSPNTGDAGIIGVAALALLGGAAVLTLRKKAQ
ncbi:NPXTG-anchored protein [Acetanaerobacterium sp. MSJ-12]|uniref:NPXTG-anchored protein n=1 Tax=Acetanaerobacterium sp. MSJ-12 TaxID=2841535 RepID=UPI001C0ED3B8|nr:NPXTG-anchored protein [Acetanaerobacterium sp. MSJ-12]MBU5419061.1 NPXTG-anchored protein [Acetanaerobacterium sp. MSJ-12]